MLPSFEVTTTTTRESLNLSGRYLLCLLLRCGDSWTFCWELDGVRWIGCHVDEMVSARWVRIRANLRSFGQSLIR